MTAPSTAPTGVHRGLADVRHQSLQNTIGNRTLNKASITLEAGDKKDIESQTVAIEYSIDGIVYTKSAIADLNVTVTDYEGSSAVQAADTTCYYTLCLDSSGNVTSYKGEDGGGIAAHPASLCAFCVIKVVTVGVTFTQGTTLYDAAGVTSTFKDVTCLPAAAF